MGFRALRLLTVFGIGLLACLRGLLWYDDVSTSPGCIERDDHELAVRVNKVKPNPPGAVLLDATVEDVRTTPCQALLGRKLRLSWYRNGFVPEPGSRLQMQARLRKPWGSKNPGGFDYGLWLLGQGYTASGYIRSAHAITSTAPPWRPVMQLDANRYVHADLLNAIVLGDRAGVSSEQWALFRATGTIHLVVISGLHVGVFLALIYSLVLAALRVLPWRRVWLVPHLVAGVAGVGAVALLVLQTGANAPVLRAGLMAAGVALTMVILRRIPLWYCFALMALVALLLQPRMVLQQGFWLSYAAVASLLVYFAPRIRPVTWTRGLLACQAVLFVALFPWLGITAGEIPLISPVANLLVVPVMTLWTIPLGMAGVLFGTLPVLSSPAHWCLLAADMSLSVVLHLLTKLQGTLPSLGYFPVVVACAAFAAFMIASLPLPLKMRLLATGGWLPVMLPLTSGIPFGEFRVIALDVGQGSSAIVDTRHHRLVVDAGARFPSGFSQGESVVIPALRSTGGDRVDRLLVSHGDNDHAGGMASLTRRYPAAELTGLHTACRDGERWQWDGVHFRVIVDANGRTTNDRSCTLHIDNGRRSAYLSGDIGARAERRLHERLPAMVDLLLAPHHGSASSSTPSFVNRVRPGIVVFSAGPGNRYGHPRPAVVARYQRLAARTYVTAAHGAVVWHSEHASVKTWR